MPNLAPAPSRSTSQITLTFGMLPIPIRLFAGTTKDEDSFDRKMFTPAGNPVNFPAVDSVTREEIPRGECIKKVAVGDQFVELNDDEIAIVTSDLVVNKGAVPILTFIPASEIGTRYRVKSSYQARPQLTKVGKANVPNPHADKLFVVLTETLGRNDAAALVRVGLRGAAKYGALTADGTFHFLHFDGEVRAEYEMPSADVTDDELEMANKLFEAIGTDTPDLENEAGRQINEYLLAKAAGGETAVAVEAPVVDTSMDLTAMLAASVAATKAS